MNDDDAALVKLALDAADLLERIGTPGHAGLLHRLARRIAELSPASTGPDACRGCGAVLSRANTGRPRKWCGRGRCERRTRENAKLAS